MYDWIGKITKNEKKLKTAGKVLRYLPGFFVYLLCKMAGTLIYVYSPSLRKRVKQNMVEILEINRPQQTARFCRRYFQNIFITLYEILIESYALEQVKNRKFQIDGESYLREVLNLGKGVILFTPHMGNFFHYYWYLSKKYPCLTVVTAGSEELRPLYLMFQRFGCRGLDYDATPPLKLFRTLRSHLQGNGVIFLLGDFWRPSFPPATLFGRTLRCPGGTADLALKNQIPVIPFYGFREKLFQHRLVFGPPVFLYKEYKPHQRAEAINKLNLFLEQVVNALPEQWFYWFNVNERWEYESSYLLHNKNFNKN